MKKRIAKIIIIIYFLVLGIPSLLLLIVRMPQVQNFVIRKLTEKLSSDLKSQINIGSIDINYFLNISLNNILIKDHKNNDLIKIEKIKVNPFKFSINQNKFYIHKVLIKKPYVNLVYYENEKNLNLQFLLDYFSSEDTTKSTSEPISIVIRKFEIENGTFVYQDRNATFETDSVIDFNNLQITNLNLKIKNLKIKDTIFADIENLSFNEKSGFSLNSMKALLTFHDKFVSLKNFMLKTNNTDLNADLTFAYNNLSAFNNFVDSVDITANFKNSFVHFDDIYKFASDVKAIKKLSIGLDGKVNGTINNLTAENLTLSTGDSTIINLNAHVTNLTDFENSFIDLQVVNSKSGFADLITLFKNTGNNPANLSNIKHFRTFTLDGYLKGYLNNFETRFNFYSNAGSCVLRGNYEEKTRNKAQYFFDLSTNNFELGRLLATTSLGKITSQITIKGEGLDFKKANLQIKGKINSINANRYDYKNITIDGKLEKGHFDGHILINDPNLYLEFLGEANLIDSLKQLDFTVDLEKANLNKLNLNRNDSLATLKGKFVFNATFTKINDFIGKLNFSNITYNEGKTQYYVKSLELSQVLLPNHNKKIEINSDLINGYIEGKYNFEDLSIVIEKFLNEYLTKIDIKKEEKKFEHFDLKFSFDIKKFDLISALFIPSLKIKDKAKFSGKFNSEKNLLTINFNADSILFDNIAFAKVDLKLETFQKKIYLSSNINKLSPFSDVFLENLNLSGVIVSDSINYTIYWNNNVDTNNISGSINGIVTLPDTNTFYFYFVNSYVVLNNNRWEILNNNKIGIFRNLIAIEDLRIKKNDEEIYVFSPPQQDNIKIEFTNFNLKNFEPLLKNYDIDIKGLLSGNVELKDINTNAYFIANFVAKDFYLQNEFLGNLQVTSQYNSEDKSVFSDINIKYKGNVGTIEPINVSGYYFTDRKDNAIDYKVKFSNFNLKTLNPFLTDILKILDGRIAGELSVKGSFEKPQIRGKIQFIRTIMKVYYLNSQFSFAHDFEITENSITAKQMPLIDARGNKAIIDISMTHKYFNDIKYDIKLKTENDFLFLNTTANDNEYFYGTVFGKGFVTASGSSNNVVVNINARTGKGTYFSLPISESGYVSENTFITFVSKKDTIEESGIKVESTPQQDFNFVLNLDLEVTRDALLEIIFDPKVGDIIRARGEGNLKINLDLINDLLMFGELNIKEGDYLFTLENIINKKFYIADGSTIKWSGDPYNASINIKTYYPTKTALYALVSHIDPSEVYKRKTNVNLELNLKNNLFSPDITFDITLPNEDDNVRNLVKTALNSEQELNRQAFALLVFNSFMPPEQVAFNAVSSQGIGTTSTELLSNQLSNWLSQISKDFDLGVKYRPGSELNSEEVELMFSTQLFDNRLKIEGNVGFAGQQHNAMQTQQSQLLGDFTLEYKITDDGRWSARAFNRSNQLDIILKNAPYTQGVGVFYRREFDRINDFFKRKRKSKAN